MLWLLFALIGLVFAWLICLVKIGTLADARMARAVGSSRQDERRVALGSEGARGRRAANQPLS